MPRSRIAAGDPAHDGGGDPVEGGDELGRASADGFAGHAEDDAGGLVLGDGQAPASRISSRPPAPSSPMPVMITPAAMRAGGLGGGAEEDFDAGSMAADRRAVRQFDAVAATGAADQAVGVAGDHQGPAGADRVVVLRLGDFHRDLGVVVEPAANAPVKSRRHVLNDHDPGRVGRKSCQQLLNRLDAARC